MYALSEWGYKRGTAREVIRDILKRDGSLSKEEVIKKVNKERYFKNNTIRNEELLEERMAFGYNGRHHGLGAACFHGPDDFRIYH